MNIFERTLRIVAFAAVTAVALLQGYRLLIPTQSNSAVAAAKLIGRRLDQLPSDPSGPKGTLVASLATNCVFCTASAPFYKKLLTEVLPAKPGIASVAFMPEEKDRAEGYLEEVVGANFGAVVRGKPLGVVVTPALMLVDNRGVVKNVWIGQLGSDKEQEVVSAIEGLAQ